MKKEKSTEAKERALKVINESDIMLLCTDTSCIVYGPTLDLVTAYMHITKAMLDVEGCDENILKIAFDLAMSGDTDASKILTTALEKLLDQLKDLKNKIEGE